MAPCTALLAAIYLGFTWPALWAFRGRSETSNTQLAICSAAKDKPNQWAAAKLSLHSVAMMSGRGARESEDHHGRHI